MSAVPPDLTDLRRRIDAIDDRMHDLLIERAGIVAQVAASKRQEDVAFYQPGREAQILRRLAARHHGVLPLASVLRIWRELLAATVRLETRLAIAVFAPAEAQGFWDLARDHYGSCAPISAYRSTVEVIGAVNAGHAAVGILPMPQEDDSDPWWRHLALQHDAALRVIARLPFGLPGNARSDGSDALVVGRCVQQQTGWDRTFLIAESGLDFGRVQVLRGLSSASLVCIFFASCEHHGARLNLIEIDDFVPVCDPRLAEFQAGLGCSLCRLRPFGGYAVPLSMATPSSSGAKG